MLYEDFIEMVSVYTEPVLLLEGKRKVPGDIAAKMANLTAKLAIDTDSIFRSGNAPGTDRAFMSEVRKLVPHRCEYIIPFLGHYPDSIPDESAVHYPDELSPDEILDIKYHINAACPERSLLIKNYRQGYHNTGNVKSLYFIRNTMKVMGAASLSLDIPQYAIMYDDRDKPMEGGTGFTIKMCRYLNIMVILQNDWLYW